MSDKAADQFAEIAKRLAELEKEREEQMARDREQQEPIAALHRTVQYSARVWAMIAEGG